MRYVKHFKKYEKAQKLQILKKQINETIFLKVYTCKEITTLMVEYVTDYGSESGKQQHDWSCHA